MTVSNLTTKTKVTTSTTNATLLSSIQPSSSSKRSLMSTPSTSLSYPSSNIGTTSSTTAPHPAPTSSSAYTTASPGTPEDSDDSEPKTELYVWQLVAIGCGVFVFILFIIIGLLCVSTARVHITIISIVVRF